jgi:hypothetical protein
VPFVLAEVELPVGLVAVLITSKQSLGLGFLAGLHPLGNDIGKPALAEHLQDVLTVELPIHQHVINENQLLGGI